MDKGKLRVVEIVGAIVFIIGIVFWYATPGDVIVPPIIVMLVGIAGAGIPWLIRRNEANRSTDELAARLRAERERGDDTP